MEVELPLAAVFNTEVISWSCAAVLLETCSVLNEASMVVGMDCIVSMKSLEGVIEPAAESAVEPGDVVDVAVAGSCEITVAIAAPFL